MAKDEVIIMSEKYSQMKLTSDSFCFKEIYLLNALKKQS